MPYHHVSARTTPVRSDQSHRTAGESNDLFAGPINKSYAKLLNFVCFPSLQRFAKVYPNLKSLILQSKKFDDKWQSAFFYKIEKSLYASSFTKSVCFDEVKPNIEIPKSASYVKWIHFPTKFFSLSMQVLEGAKSDFQNYHAFNG